MALTEVTSNSSRLERVDSSLEGRIIRAHINLDGDEESLRRVLVEEVVEAVENARREDCQLLSFGRRTPMEGMHVLGDGCFGAHHLGAFWSLSQLN